MKKLSRVIIFITQLYPFPPDTGGKKKTYGVIKTLSFIGYKVILLSFREQSFPKENSSGIHGLTAYVFPRPIIDDFHSFYRFWLYLKSLLRFLPYRMVKYSSGDFEKLIFKLAKKYKPKIVYFDHLSSALYLFKMKGFFDTLFKRCRTVIDVHDIDSEVYYMKFCHERFFSFKKLVYYLEYLKSIRFENRVLGIPDKIFVMSDFARKTLLRRIQKPIHFCPTSIYFSRLDHNYDISNRVVFIGTLSWEDNKNGLRWFLDHIWPLIVKNSHEAELMIVGNYGDKVKWLVNKNTLPDGVNFIGYQKSLEDTYNQATVGIVPALPGAGVRIKTLEFMSHGVPIVTTQAGVFGIRNVINGRHCYIEDNAERFACRVIELLHDKTRRRLLGLNAKKLMASTYTFKNLRNFLYNNL